MLFKDSATKVIIFFEIKCFLKKNARKRLHFTFEKVYAEAEMDKSDMLLLQNRNNLIPNEGNLISMEKQAQKTENSIKKLHTKNHLNTKK